MAKWLDWIFSRAAHPTTEYLTLHKDGSTEIEITLTEDELRELEEDLLDDGEDEEDDDDLEIIVATPRTKSASTGRPLENLFCYIEYRDAKRALTRRPITILSLKGEGASIGIYAVCHLRKASRLFRCDRIENVITADGEVFEARVFLRDILDVVIEEAHAHSGAAPATLPNFRAEIMSPLTVLVAAAKSDGDYHIEEIDRIVHYAEMEAMHLHTAGRVANDMTIEASDALCIAIRSMRPQARSLARHIMSVLTMPDDARLRFKRALEAVIIADGHIHARETDFWNDFDELAVKAGLDPVAVWGEVRAASDRTAA